MSYFILTHPRSGSSNLTVALSKSLLAWNLDEFLHLRNSQLWGDYKKILSGNRREGSVYTLKNLDHFNLSEDTSDLKNVRDCILIEKQMSKSDLISWRDLEIERRLKFLDTLSSKNQSFVVKIFIDSDRWLDYDFANRHSLILYRKNFLDAILSMLIKNRYEKQFGQKRSNDRYKGRDMNVPDFSFSISHRDFLLETDVFFKFLKFCKRHKQIKFISYEEIYFGSSNLDIFDVSIEKKLLKDIDIKLEYAKKKKDYINNYKDLENWISSIIKEESLQDICQTLNINFIHD